MNVSRFVLTVGAGSLLSACSALSGSDTSKTPTTEMSHPLDPQQRINDHAQRLADGIARYLEVKGHTPLTQRDLALAIANDGQPCFTEILKDHWWHPYAYAPLDTRGRFQLVSAGPNGLLGDGDDLRVDRGPGDASVRTYGYSWHPGE